MIYELYYDGRLVGTYTNLAILLNIHAALEWRWMASVDVLDKDGQQVCTCVYNTYLGWLVTPVNLTVLEQLRSVS